MIRQSFLLLSLSAFYLGEVGCLLSSQDKLTDAHVLSELMVEKLIVNIRLWLRIWRRWIFETKVFDFC